MGQQNRLMYYLVMRGDQIVLMSSAIYLSHFNIFYCSKTVDLTAHVAKQQRRDEKVITCKVKQAKSPL